MSVTLRPLCEEDHPQLHKLYLRLLKEVPQHRAPSLKQFSAQLTSSRLFPDAGCFEPEAEIALVAEQDKEIVAYANGCLFEGDYVVDGGAYLRMFLVSPEAREAGLVVARAVVEHLEGFDPDFIQAFGGGMGPAPSGFALAFLPSGWSWLGSCLSELGFEVSATQVRLARSLKRPPGEVAFPKGFGLASGQTVVKGQVLGLDPRYNVGYRLMKGEEAVGWCGNVFGGSFLKGAGFRTVFTHWFSVQAPYLGQGLGRALFRHGLRDAYSKGARQAQLVTDMDNFVAQSLYRSEGYQTVDTGCAFRLVRGRRIFLLAEAALGAGESVRVKALLEQTPALARLGKPSVLAADPPTLLETLAQSGSAEMGQLLLDAGAAVTGLESAVDSGNTELVGVLLANGAELKAGMLEKALLHGRSEMALLLVEHGAEVSLACRAGLGDLSRLGSLDSGDRFEALQLASRNGQAEVVRFLLKDQDPNGLYRSCSALHRAAISGNLEVVKLLLSAGATPAVCDSEYDCAPVEWARWWGHTNVVEHLESL